MTEGGQEAVRADDDVVPAADARRLEERGRELDGARRSKSSSSGGPRPRAHKKAISLSSLPPRDASR
jgi:hypothetical protein